MKANTRRYIFTIAFSLFKFTVIFSFFTINSITQVYQDRLNVKKVWIKEATGEHTLSPLLHRDSIVFSLLDETSPKESKSVQFFDLKNLNMSSKLDIPQSLHRFIGLSNNTAIFIGWPWGESEQKIIAIDINQKKIKWISSVRNTNVAGYVPIQDIRVLNSYLAVLSHEGHTVGDYMDSPFQVTGSFVKIFDLRNGKELSSVKYNSEISFLDSSDKNSLYINDRSFIYKLNEDQKIDKKLSLSLEGISPFFIAKDYYLYVDSKKETIGKMIIDKKSKHEMLWTSWVSNIKTPDSFRGGIGGINIEKAIIFEDQLIALVEKPDGGESIGVSGFLVSHSVKDGSLNWISPSSWYYEMTPKIFLDRYLIFGDSNATRDLSDDAAIIIDVASGDIVSKIEFPIRNTPSFERNTFILKSWKRVAQYRAFAN